MTGDAREADLGSIGRINEQELTARVMLVNGGGGGREGGGGGAVLSLRMAVVV